MLWLLWVLLAPSSFNEAKLLRFRVLWGLESLIALPASTEAPYGLEHALLKGFRQGLDCHMGGGCWQEL